MDRRAAEALRAGNPGDGDSICSVMGGLSLSSALTDISNTAAAPPGRGRKQAPAQKARRGRAAPKAAELEEADCVSRSCVAEADGDGGSLWAVAQDEAWCTLRAAPRKSGRAAAARPPAPTKATRASAKEVASASESDAVEETDSDEDAPEAAKPAGTSTSGLRLSRSRDTSSHDPPPAKTPAAVKISRAGGDENAAVATPAQPRTARQGSRFAAMQTPAASAQGAQLPPIAAASRLPPTTVPPLRPRPPGNAQYEAPPDAGKRARGRSRVSFAASAQPAPVPETPAVQPRTAARKKAGAATAGKSTRRQASLGMDAGSAAEAGDEAEASAGKGTTRRSAAPFVIHRAPDLGELEGEVGDLGPRMRALALGSGGLVGPGKESAGGSKGAERGPVLLILDEELQSLPWESLPALQRHRCLLHMPPLIAIKCRDFVCKWEAMLLCKAHGENLHVSRPFWFWLVGGFIALCMGCYRMYRAPSLACACAIAARGCSPYADSSGASEQAYSEAQCAEQPASCGPLSSVDVHDTVFMLNPSGDLASTQSTFQQLFQQQHGWQVCPSRQPYIKTFSVMSLSAQDMPSTGMLSWPLLLKQTAICDFKS